jgi:hypothetical protein
LRVGRCAARSQARWVSVLDVVEYLGDEFRLCDVCDDAKLATAQRTQWPNARPKWRSISRV